MAGWRDLWSAWRPDMWPEWHPDTCADLYNTERGGVSRDRAYEAELTSEGREAFAGGGYLADPSSPQSDPAGLRSRVELSGGLARNLSPAAAARVWHGAYQGQPGVLEYQLPPRETDRDLEAG